MSMECSTVCFTDLKSGFSSEGYVFIRLIYSDGICWRIFLSGSTDLMAPIWKRSHSSGGQDECGNLGGDGVGCNDASGIGMVEAGVDQLEGAGVETSDR